MPEDGDGGIQAVGLDRLGELEKAVFADESLGAPCAIAHKIDAFCGGCDGVFGQLQMQLITQEILNASQVFIALLFGQIEQDEVIHVAAVFFDAQLTLDEGIHRVHVDQRIKLAEQVADGNAHGIAVIGKDHHQIDKAFVLDLFFNQAAQYIAVNAVEEFTNVQLDRVGFRPRCLEGTLRIVGGFVGAIAGAAGKRLFNQARIENRVDNPVDGMLHHQIRKRWCVNLARLWLEHHEGVIRVWPVCTITQLAVQDIKTGRKPPGELKAGAFAALVAGGIVVRRQQGLIAECLFVEKSVTFHAA